MIGPTLERIERRLTLIEASRTLSWITVDQMTRALLQVRLGCEGSDELDQWNSTRYYAERLLNRLAEMYTEAAEPTVSGSLNPDGSHVGDWVSRED